MMECGVNFCVAVVRPGFEEAQAAELVAKLGVGCCPVLGSGWVAYRAEGTLRALVFERQRLVGAGFVPLAEVKPLADGVLEAMLRPLVEGRCKWLVHAYGLGDGEGVARRAQGVAGVLLRYAKKHEPWTFKRVRKEVSAEEGWVLQLVLTEEGLWYAAQRVSMLVDALPGGVRRMRFDDESPSRSYLKLEEVFQRMGVYPEAGQSAVDLGAAPGGWTYSLLKHGCDVVAVDHGPMRRLPGDHRMTHLREDGLTYQPSVDGGAVDWMVSDMLISPGKVMGLLRRWTQRGWCRYFVVTIKVPQEEVYVPLAPVAALLDGVKGVCWWRMKQLYHNRREVTVWGELSGG